jgi:hypothetical protein
MKFLNQFLNIIKKKMELSPQGKELARLGIQYYYGYHSFEFEQFMVFLYRYNRQFKTMYKAYLEIYKKYRTEMKIYKQLQRLWIYSEDYTYEPIIEPTRPEKPKPATYRIPSLVALSAVTIIQFCYTRINCKYHTHDCAIIRKRIYYYLNKNTMPPGGFYHKYITDELLKMLITHWYSDLTNHQQNEWNCFEKNSSNYAISKFQSMIKLNQSRTLYALQNRFKCINENGDICKLREFQFYGLRDQSYFRENVNNRGYIYFGVVYVDMYYESILVEYGYKYLLKGLLYKRSGRIVSRKSVQIYSKQNTIVVNECLTISDVYRLYYGYVGRKDKVFREKC